MRIILDRDPQALASRLAGMSTADIRLAHGTLNARDPADLTGPELAVLAVTTSELADRGEPMCPDCAGLTSGFTTGVVHTGRCPQTRQKEAS